MQVTIMLTKLLVSAALAFSLIYSAHAQKPTPVPETETETDFSDVTTAYADYSGNPDDAEDLIDGLVDIGLVDDGGELLFTSEMATEVMGGEGGTESTYVNYAVGALTSVRELPDGTTGVCTFITRGIAAREGGIGQAVAVVVTSDDEILALEAIPGRSQPRRTMIEFPSAGRDTFYNPQYVLVVVKDDTLSVWINGERYLDAWELQGELPEGGEYEEDVVTTVNPEAGCVMTSLWGYGF
jgi:hypothetical protein